MRTYERNGVHLDQCSECRGIFLDRGELERLLDADERWSQQVYGAPPGPAPAPRPPATPYPDPRYPEPRYGDPRSRDPRSGHKKRKHWLEELFD